MGDSYIYSLSDPRTNEVRYVGKTKYADLYKRKKGHINHTIEGRVNHRTAWIQSLLKENLTPTIELIDIVPDEEWQFWEVYWISQIKSWGFNLVNGDNGGLGGHRFSIETLAEMSRSRKGNPGFFKGRKHTEESKQKIREALKKISRVNMHVEFNDLARKRQLETAKGNTYRRGKKHENYDSVRMTKLKKGISRQVVMCDKRTKKEINVFLTGWIAAKEVILNKLSEATIATVNGNIFKSIKRNGSAYGFRWKYKSFKEKVLCL